MTRPEDQSPECGKRAVGVDVSGDLKIIYAAGTSGARPGDGAARRRVQGVNNGSAGSGRQRTRDRRQRPFSTTLDVSKSPVRQPSTGPGGISVRNAVHYEANIRHLARMPRSHDGAQSRNVKCGVRRGKHQ